MQCAARLAVLAAVALAQPVGSAARNPPRKGSLTLALPDPFIVADVAGVALRLRVALDGRGVIDLNRAAAARLPVAFEASRTAGVGRIDLRGTAAAATMTVEGRSVPVALWSFGDCCTGVDGAVDAALLPFADVRFVQREVPGGVARSFVLARDEDYGMGTRQAVAGRPVQLQFALDRRETLATAAAGAMLAAAQGGRFEGGYDPVLVAWGVSRPSRVIAFARPASLAGFRFDRLRTRTADFGGRTRLPSDPREAGEIVVSRRRTPQHGWAAVMIGRDRLDRCAEMLFRPATLLLTLRCDFAG